MKPKILIIAYYHFPLNAVGSYRSQAMYDACISVGFDVTLVTRHWLPQLNSWADAMAINISETTITKTENGTTIHLPYNIKVQQHSNKIVSKIAHFWSYISGNLQPEINAYQAFYPYLKNYLTTNSFDALFVTAPPHNSVKLASKLSTQFNIPLFVDFRDFFNMELFNTHYIPTIKTEILNKISLFYLKKWTANAHFLTSVSAPYASKIEHLLNKKTNVVTNGYEQSKFENAVVIPNKKFTLRYIGSFSYIQNPSLFIKALTIFKATHPNFTIELVGIMNDNVTSLFEKNFDSTVLTVIKTRVSQQEVINKLVNTDVLFFPSWKGYPGIYGTKIFEYVASGSFVLLAPGDDDVIDALLTETKAGTIANSVNEIVIVLEEQYALWQSGNNKINPNQTIINYSRERIMLGLAQQIKYAINN
jgi:glycosyltransferase involved in cell wall biosynthesis